VTLPEIYQRKLSCVNDICMMIDVSIASVYSGGVLTIFCLFSVFFSVFPLHLKKEDNPLLVCACFDYVS